MSHLNYINKKTDDELNKIFDDGSYIFTDNKYDKKYKKFELTQETICIDGRTLYRIRALRSFNNVSAGELGGFVEKEKNLSHDGNAWVGEDAKVYENARVYDDAMVYGCTMVYGGAWISGNAKVYDYARIAGEVNISDNANVYGYSFVYGSAWVYDNAQIFDNAQVGGDMIIHDNAKIMGYSRIYGDVDICGDMVINYDVIEIELLKIRKRRQ